MVLALAASFLFLGGRTSALSAEASRLAGGNAEKEVLEVDIKPKAPGTEAGPAVLTGIFVFFKLDFRMNGPTYGGERWVSPATFVFAQGGKQLTVEAKAQGIDANGRPMDVSPQWVPTAPGVVTVTQTQGSDVKITVSSPGQCSLKVTSQEVSKELSIKSVLMRDGNGLQVDISQ